MTTGEGQIAARGDLVGWHCTAAAGGDHAQALAGTLVASVPQSLSGPTVVAGELIERVTRELPGLAELGQRERLLAAAWLLSLRSARTRRAYFADFGAWLGWLAGRDLEVLAARRVHVDLWVQQQLDAGAEPASVRRRLSGISSFYRYAAAHDLVAGVPTDGVARPVVDADYTATVGLDRDQARAMLCAAERDCGRHRLRTATVVKLLLHNALRVDETCAADVADLGMDKGHRVLTVVRKGSRKTRVPLTPATGAALDAYLADRATRAGLVDVRELTGPLLATDTGGRMRQSHLWELVRRLARAAGIAVWDQLSPHSLRHTGITLALDAGVPLRDVQDYAGHKDPRTTRRYDHSRDNLDRNAAYTVAAYLA
jgi:site-specific recombinase XerD